MPVGIGFVCILPALLDASVCEGVRAAAGALERYAKHSLWKYWEAPPLFIGNFPPPP